MNPQSWAPRLESWAGGGRLYEQGRPEADPAVPLPAGPLHGVYKAAPSFLGRCMISLPFIKNDRYLSRPIATYTTSMPCQKLVTANEEAVDAGAAHAATAITLRINRAWAQGDMAMVALT